MEKRFDGIAGYPTNVLSVKGVVLDTSAKRARATGVGSDAD